MAKQRKKRGKHLTRREFLGTVAGTAAGLAAGERIVSATRIASPGERPGMTSPTPPKITGIPLLGQVTGTPGAPGATTTIDGRYLPAPQQPFIGHIEPNAAQLTPAWPLLTGPPNVVLIMIDDEGFGAPSTFGSLIPTPTMDRIAKMGLTYTRFHTILPFRTTLLAMSNGRRRWRT